MKLRTQNFSSHSQDDLDLNPIDWAMAPASSTFMWGLVGSDVWAFSHETSPVLATVASPDARPEVPVELLHPTVWAAAAQGAEGAFESMQSFDLPNPPDLASEPLWTESWSQVGAATRSMPAMIGSEAVADLAQRDHAFQEIYHEVEVERAPKPVVPPSDLFLVDGQGCPSGSWSDSVTLVGTIRQEGPDVSLLSSDGWI